MSDSFDVIVIGGGPAGYPAAIRAAQLGFSVACIDKWRNRDGKPAFGGTCLNAGCIPSKALLESSELYHRARHEFSVHGIQIQDAALDLARMQQRKTDICRQLTGGIAQLFKGNGVTGIHGTARLLGGGKVEVTPMDGEARVLTGRHIVIATGSEPVELRKIAPFDGKRIVDSWGALDFDEVPGRLGVIGAGVIGLELGSVWSRLGAETIILEALPEFLPAVDRDIARLVERELRKQGLDIRLGAKVTGTRNGSKGIEVRFEIDGKEASERFDKLIVAVGRRPNTDGLGVEQAGVELDERGFVKVDDRYRTTADGIYAIGDVIGNPMLAHKGIEEGVALAEQLAGQATRVNYDAIPSVIYTAPEVAWVGLSEQQARDKGFEVKTGSAPFAASGRAKALEMQSGAVKFIADAKTDRILGVHMAGPYVSELVAEAVLAMEYGATCEDIALTMHAHPSLSEIFHEAALATLGHAIHTVNRRKR